jgi:hypothetical protein
MLLVEAELQNLKAAYFPTVRVRPSSIANAVADQKVRHVPSSHQDRFHRR